MVLKRLSTSFRSAKRIGQTTLALQKAGLRWLQNRDQPLEILARETVEDLGSTYIKLGQLIASSPSLFPEALVLEFQKCLDQTAPIVFSEIEKILQQEFGDRTEQLFNNINPVPLASASIAQVHAATLHSGEDVVIKVQKPNVQNVIETDSQFLQFSAWLFEKFSPSIPEDSLTDIVKEIRDGMLEECDFIKESNNIELFRQFLEDSNNQRVVVPKVYRRASTSKVLTMQRFYGASLSDVDAVKKITNNPQLLLNDTLNTWFASLMQCQIYHADLHAGNVMVLEDGHVGFIDFGIVGRISPPVWEGLLTLGTAIPQKDFMTIARALTAMGATNTKVNIDLFAHDMEKLYNEVMENTDGTDELLQLVTLQLAKIGRQHGVRFPREFTLLVKQFLYFDRYIQLFSPNMSFFDDERMSFLTE